MGPCLVALDILDLCNHPRRFEYHLHLRPSFCAFETRRAEPLAQGKDTRFGSTWCQHRDHSDDPIQLCLEPSTWLWMESALHLCSAHFGLTSLSCFFLGRVESCKEASYSF